MGTKYIVNFTWDPSNNRQFALVPYTTNGPVLPNIDTLDDKATDAATTLLLYGKGSSDYGERIQENMVHMLENFSSEKEPVRPINGQMWNNTYGAVNQLTVFNSSKYLIVNDPAHTGVNEFGMAPTDITNILEEGEMLARFTTLKNDGITISIIQSGTLIKERYIINTVYNDGGLVTVKVSPTPPASRTGGDWYIGGWEYILQNNAPLRSNFNANGWNVINLNDPVNLQDAATKGWVETEIATQLTTQNQIGELIDVAATASSSPSVNEILAYSGSEWKNVDGSSIFLKLSTGGTMGGSIDMGGQIIYNLPLTPGFPSLPHHVATKDYVDQELISLGSYPTVLNDLTDVTITAPLSNSVLRYDGVKWVNVLSTSLPFLPLTGGTLTGNLTLAGPGHANTPGLAATEFYVDAEIIALNSALTTSFNATINALPAEDYVTVGSFNPATQELTLTRLSGDVVVTNMTGAGGLSTAITHNIGDPNIGNFTIGVDIQRNGGLAWEEKFWDEPTYPAITLDQALGEINLLLGRFVAPVQRLVFVSNGNSTVYLGDTTGGAEPNQCNPTGQLGYSYVVGDNSLQVYSNGIKQYVSNRGFFNVFGQDPFLVGFSMFAGTKTGLNPLTAYTFDVNVNGLGNVAINLPASTDNTIMGGVIAAINAIADANYFDAVVPNNQYAFGVKLVNGIMTFYSCLPGTGSTIVVTENFFFNEIVGDAGTTGAFTIALPLSGGFGGELVTNDTNYLPTTLGYNEIGRYGKESQGFVFNAGSVPGSGAVIEILIGRDLFGERI